MRCPHGKALTSRIEQLEAERDGWREGAFIASQRIGQLEAALSRYGDHDRVCDARENLPYPAACSCGFVALVEELFPSRAALREDPR